MVVLQLPFTFQPEGIGQLALSLPLSLQVIVGHLWSLCKCKSFQSRGCDARAWPYMQQAYDYLCLVRLAKDSIPNIRLTFSFSGGGVGA
jgi:hypothetical protein